MFDEKRYFESGESSCTFDCDGHTIGISICEDFWGGFDASAAPRYDSNPLDELISSGCSLIIASSASPFVTGKREIHVQYATEFALKNGVTVAMCNQVGGNDDLVFDGGSFVVSPDGMLGELPLFETGSISIDLDGPSCEATLLSEHEERFKAIVLGT